MRTRTALAAALCAAAALPAPSAHAASADAFVITGSGAVTLPGSYGMSGTATAVGTGLGTYGCSGSVTLPGLAGFGDMTLYCGPWTFDCTLVHEGGLAAAAVCPRNVGTFPPVTAYAGVVDVRPHDSNPTTSADFVIVLARASA